MAQSKTMRVTTRSSTKSKATDTKVAVHVSTVRLSNVRAVQNLEDLLHLITNTIRSYSTKKSTLRKMYAGTDSITCKVVGKQLAMKLARKIESSFKKYHPEVIVHKPKDQTFYDIEINFKSPVTS